MSYGRIITAIVIFSIVFGLYYYMEYYKQSKPEFESKGTNIPLVRFNPKEIESFEISKGISKLQCSLDDVWKWALHKDNGIKVPANPEVIENLLTGLSSFDGLKMVSKEKTKNLADFGLSGSSISTIKIFIKSKKPIIITFGANNPSSSGVYTMINTIDGIYICDMSYLDKFIKQEDEIREKRLARFDPEKIKTLDINTKKTSVELSKENNIWLIYYNGKKRVADKDIANSIMTKLQTLEGIHAIDDDPVQLDKYGLSKPRESIKIKDDVSNYIINIGNEIQTEKRSYIDSNLCKSVYLIDDESLAFFDKTPFDIREKSLNRFDASFIDKIEFLKGSNTFSLVKDIEEIEWKFIQPFEGKAEGDMVANIIYALEKVKGEEFLDATQELLRQYELLNPFLTVIAYDTQNKEQYLFYFGKKIKDNLIAATNKEKSEIYLVSVETIGLIPDNILESLRSKKLFGTLTYTVNDISIKWDNIQFKSKMDDKGEWNFISPVDKKMSKSFTKFLSLIDGLKIKNFVDDNPNDLAKYGLNLDERYIELGKDGYAQEKLVIGNTDKESESVYLILKPHKSVYSIGFKDIEKVRNYVENFSKEIEK